MATALPATSGSLSSKPLAHLLVYMLDRQLSGSLQFSLSNGRPAACVVLSRGQVIRIKTSAPIAFLGSVLRELGFIDDVELEASLADAKARRILHGQALVARGAISAEDLATGLREQTLRKLGHLFSLGAGEAGSDVTFAFYADVDLLGSYGGDDVVFTDPAPAIWRGIRDYPSEAHVLDVLRRIGDQPCRLAQGARVDRFRFSREELAAVECLRIDAVSHAQLRDSGMLLARTVDLIIYCLIITKQVELIASTRGLSASGSHPSLSAPPTSHRAASGPPALQGSLGAMATGSFRATGPSAPVPPSAPPSNRNVLATGMPPPPNSNRPRSGAPSARAQAMFERAKEVQKEDFYRRLSVPRDADMAQITSAFMALRRLWDPTVVGAQTDDEAQARSAVFAALKEAHDTLSDPMKRQQYTGKLLLGNAHLADPAEDLASSGADNEFDGAKACLAKNDLERAERLARRAQKAKPESAEALALLAWIEAQRPTMSEEGMRARIIMLDKAVRMNGEYADAWFYRGMLHKRGERFPLAVRDLRRTLELNPDHQEAQKELRVCEVGKEQQAAEAAKASGGLLQRIFKR